MDSGAGAAKGTRRPSRPGARTRRGPLVRNSWRRRGRPRGFGLLEVIVALFVLGVALTGIVRSLAQGVEVAGAAHRSMLARELARARALDLSADAEAELAAVRGSGWESVAVERETLACRRRVRGWRVGARAWFWIEVECGLEAEVDRRGGSAPGHASLMVAR